MRRFLVTILAATVTVVLASTPPAGAAASPKPKATLLGTGVITTEEGEEAYIEVEALDPDGIITEITVLWGDRSITFAHSFPCLIPPTPAPGTPHRFLISHLYAEPGTYTVRYTVSSIDDCEGDVVEQHSRPYVLRLASS